jgi:hypothetical protein
MRGLTAAIFAAAVAVSACSGGEKAAQVDAPKTDLTLPAATPGNDPPPGVESFGPLSNDHVRGPVSYPQSPPVGGPHAFPPNWQNCAFYDEPVPSEHAVHSTEHGAVWITYSPDLSKEEIGLLATLAGDRVLVSPFPDLPKPVVASAWGKQLQLDSVTDVRLVDFIEAFTDAPTSPEAGAPCTNGTNSLTLVDTG